MRDAPEPSKAPATATADDPYFILRDTRALFVHRLDQLARLSGISNGAREAFIQKTGEAFDLLASGNARGGFGETAGLTASRISLVGNDALELEIRISDIIHRLKDNKRIDHWRTQLRLTALLRRPGMSADDNPAGFSALEEGLWGLCDAIDGDTDRKFDALDRIQELLQEQLPDVYNDLNAHLEKSGVEAAQSPVIRRTGSDHRQGAAHDNLVSNTAPTTASASGLFAALQQSRNQHAAPTSQFSPSNGNGFPTLHFPGEIAPGSSSGNAALDATTLITLNRLMASLQNLETNVTTARPLRSSDLAEKLPGAASVALDTLAMIFDGIFSAPELPEPVKAAIGRLQLPLVRIAIAEADFFSDVNHPARRLVNRMADAARGLSPDCAQDHPLCAALSAFANHARQTLEKTPPDPQGRQDISTLLDAIEKLNTKKNEAQQRAAQPYIALTEAQEARDAGLLHSTEWLQRILQTPALPPRVADFFVVFWCRRMQQAFIADNAEGSQWQDAANCAIELAWSTTPKETPEDRQRLAALIPTLIRRLNAGLDQLGVAAAERTPFLDAFFDLQTAALRNRSAPPHPRQYPDTITASNAPSGSLQLLEQKGVLVQYISGTPAPATPSLAIGDWLSITLPDGERLLGRYCGSTSRQTRAIFHNSDWGFAVALPFNELETQLQNGLAKRDSAPPLFDRAASLALEQLGHR